MKYVLFFLLGFFPSLLYAEPFVIQSGPEQVALLELYSSEGCSSCPPADQWIAGLQNHPDLWKKFIPVAFHVTYWDRLGWEDPFASLEFDERQKAYVEIWKETSIVTPTLVLNGKNWEDWYEVRKIPAFESKQVGILSAKALDAEEYLISFKPVALISKPLEIHGALLGFAVSSSVTEGENIGKKLTHHFLVLNYRKKDFAVEGNHFTTSILFSRVRKFESARWAVVFWVSEKKNPTPIQAVGGFVDGQAWI